MNRRDFVLSTLSSPLVLSGWRAQAQLRPLPARGSDRGAQAGRRLHGRGGVLPRRLRLVLRAGSQPAVRRDGGLSHDVLDPAAGHALRRPRLSRRLPRHRRRALLPGRLPHRHGGEAGPARRGRLELHPRLRRRGVAQALVRHHRPQRLAAGGIPALLRQFDLRRRHHRGRGAADAAHVPREEGPALHHATHKAIDFITDAQFGPQLGIADGGWPQRFPHNPNSITSMPMPNPQQLPPDAWAGMEDGDYTLHVTFNDDVMGENIKFLTMCVMALGKTRLVRQHHARDGMHAPDAAAGAAGGLGPAAPVAADATAARPARPAGARTYEPRSLATHTTQTNIQQLFHYFTLTGDRRYLARIPEAIAWLKTCPLPPDAAARQPAARRRPHAPDLHPARHQRRDLRAPLRLQHP